RVRARVRGPPAWDGGPARGAAPPPVDPALGRRVRVADHLPGLPAEREVGDRGVPQPARRTGGEPPGARVEAGEEEQLGPPGVADPGPDLLVEHGRAHRAAEGGEPGDRL